MTDPGEVESGAPFFFEAPTVEETRVFLVDDEELVLKTLHRSLEGDGYDLRSFSNPVEALAAVEEDPPKILVTDKNMPEISGLELARSALERDPTLGVIMITGGGDEASAQEALKLGAVDYLTKPFSMSDLRSAVRRSVLRSAEREYRHRTVSWLRSELAERTRENARLTLGVLAVLVNALEARSEFFQGHSERVADLAERIARTLRRPDVEVFQIRAGALVHDIGMIAVPDSIVDKEGDLTKAEYRRLQLHCQRGADMLDPLEHLSEAARYVLEHHERLDGSGYPLGLRGDAISLGGQIVGLAEAWTGASEDRAYRSGMTRDGAFSTFSELSGTAFDPELVEALRVAEGLTG